LELFKTLTRDQDKYIKAVGRRT